MIHVTRPLNGALEKKFSKIKVRKSYDAPSYLNSANVQWASEPELGVNTTDLT